MLWLSVREVNQSRPSTNSMLELYILWEVFPQPVDFTIRCPVINVRVTKLVIHEGIENRYNAEMKMNEMFLLVILIVICKSIHLSTIKTGPSFNQANCDGSYW